MYASESSIRRDLTSLESKGLIKRSYGGAELITNFSNIISFSKRSHHNIEAKKSIAKNKKHLCNAEGELGCIGAFCLVRKAKKKTRRAMGDVLIGEFGIRGRA